MNRELLLQALRAALRNLDPRELWHAPVLLATWVASLVATICAVRASAGFDATLFSAAWLWQLAGWLWLTIVFANFVHRNDPGMLQASSRLSFLAKPRRVFGGRQLPA